MFSRTCASVWCRRGLPNYSTVMKMNVEQMASEQIRYSNGKNRSQNIAAVTPVNVIRKAPRTINGHVGYNGIMSFNCGTVVYVPMSGQLPLIPHMNSTSG